MTIANNVEVLSTVGRQEHNPTMTAMALQQARSWPNNLRSLKNKTMADVIYQYISENLRDIPTEKNNAAQQQVIRAMEIAAKFDAELMTMKRPGAPTANDYTIWRRKALQIQAAILLKISEKKANGKRARSNTGSLLGILRAWTNLQLNK